MFTEMTKQKEKPNFDLTFIFIFTKFIAQKRRGEARIRIIGVFFFHFMVLFRTVLPGKLKTKLYYRMLPRATFCYKTVKGKNKLPFCL